MASIELKYDARNPIAEKSKWQQAIDEGACSVEQFMDDLRRLVKKEYARRKKWKTARWRNHSGHGARRRVTLD